MQVCKFEDGASMSQIILIRYLTQEHYWFLFQIFLVSVVLCILPVRCKNFENLQIPNWNVQTEDGFAT
jgi:hypothetical protein